MDSAARRASSARDRPCRSRASLSESCQLSIVAPPPLPYHAWRTLPTPQVVQIVHGRPLTGHARFCHALRVMVVFQMGDKA